DEKGSHNILLLVGTHISNALHPPLAEPSPLDSGLLTHPALELENGLIRTFLAGCLQISVELAACLLDIVGHCHGPYQEEDSAQSGVPGFIDDIVSALNGKG